MSDRPTSPSISVIIPVRDAPENLRRLLDSLRRLTYPRDRLEIIVCDNGSRDHTPMVAAQHGARVLDLPTLSIAALRNRGAAEASGEVLAFVDSDCTVSPHWLSTAVESLCEPGVLASGAYPLPPTDATWVQELWTLKERIRPPVHDADWLPSMNLCVWRHAFAQIGGFDARLRTCEDVDFCYRLRAIGGIVRWDMRIEVVHFGEPETLTRLFQKERWHGLDSYRGVLHHGLRLEEIPSLLLPLVVAGSVGIPLASWLTLPLAGPLVPLLTSPLALLPPALALTQALRVSRRAGRPLQLPALTAIYLVYLWARAAALLPERRG